jgi:hypothetical protein
MSEKDTGLTPVALGVGRIRCELIDTVAFHVATAWAAAPAPRRKGNRMDADTAIQPGWTVWARDGKELGRVVSLDPQTIVVKQSGFRGGTLNVPRTAVDEVETGRVEISMTEADVKARR